MPDMTTPFESTRNARRAAQLLEYPLIRETREFTRKRLSEIMQTLFSKADDALFAQSNQGAGDSEAFEAMRQLRIVRDDIAKQFLAGFEAGYLDSLLKQVQHEGSADQSAGEAGGLSLIDEDQLEETLAIDGLIAKAEERFRNDLYAIEQRLTHVLTAIKVEENNNPVSPRVICYALRDAFKQVALDIKFKIVIFKLFDQQLMANLGGLYGDINSMLIKAGILPRLKVAASNRPETQAQQESQGDTDQTINGPEGQSSAAADSTKHAGNIVSDVFHTLQNLLSVKKYGPVAGASLSQSIQNSADDYQNLAAPGGDAISMDELFSSLSSLQRDKQISAENPNGSMAAIKAHLMESMAGTRGDERAHAIHPVHDNTIDVIGMIFEFILDEPSIPHELKALLSQLQIPILKIALLDKDFFSKKIHPARRLLNALSHACIAWQENDEAEKKRRYEKMQYIVNRILLEFDTDAKIFQELLDEFNHFIGEGREPMEVAVKEEAGSDEEKVTPGQLAFEMVEMRIEDRELPPVARDFLRDIWRKVLEFEIQTKGEDGDARIRCEKVMDDLLWSVEPKTTAADRRQLVSMLPSLLSDLRSGMQSIPDIVAEIEPVIESLQEIHIACLRGERPVVTSAKSESRIQAGKSGQVAENKMNVNSSCTVSSDDVASMIKSIRKDMEMPFGELATQRVSDAENADILLNSVDEPIADSGAEVSDFEPMESEDDEYVDLARDMELGTWIEFNQGEKKQRAKLAWKSAVMGEYVFVNRKYKVVAEKKLRELASDLRSGAAVVVENVAMFDRAIDSVINGLMKTS